MFRNQKIRTFMVVFLAAATLVLTACDSKREEPKIKKVQTVDARLSDYRQSYFFDQTVTELNQHLHKWSVSLVSSLEAQHGLDKQPILSNSIDFIVPLLKESQRGFFKKTNQGWRKEIVRTDRLLVDKEIFLEKIIVNLSGQVRSASKQNPWTLVAMGRYPKDQNGELFSVHWDPEARQLKIESRQKEEHKFSCAIQFKDSGAVESALCNNLVVFRIENKDIQLKELVYDSRKGFSGEGKVMGGKGPAEKWVFPTVGSGGGSSPTAGESL